MKEMNLKKSLIRVRKVKWPQKLRQTLQKKRLN